MTGVKPEFCQFIHQSISKMFTVYYTTSEYQIYIVHSKYIYIYIYIIIYSEYCLWDYFFRDGIIMRVFRCWKAYGVNFYKFSNQDEHELMMKINIIE